VVLLLNDFLERRKRQPYFVPSPLAIDPGTAHTSDQEALRREAISKRAKLFIRDGQLRQNDTVNPA
jgi:hypothetical protein